MDSNKFLEELREDVKTLVSDVSTMKVDQAVMKENIAEHMRRSAAAEEMSKSISNELVQTRKDFWAQIEPIKTHVNRVDGVFKFLGLIATVGGLVLGIIKLFGKI